MQFLPLAALRIILKSQALFQIGHNVSLYLPPDYFPIAALFHVEHRRGISHCLISLSLCLYLQPCVPKDSLIWFRPAHRLCLSLGNCFSVLLQLTKEVYPSNLLIIVLVALTACD